MDPYASINGISLERYAELAADVSDTQDPDEQAKIVAERGVARADWEAAKSGWTARMQDMNLIGAVATRFMPLYQAALAKKSPAPVVSFEDYVAMSGAAAVLGFQGMLAHYRLTQAQWTQIAGHWNGVIPTSPQYMQFGLLVEQEAARLRAGGAAKAVSLGAGAARAPAAASHGAGAPPPPAPAAATPYAHPGHAPQAYAAHAPQAYAAHAPNPWGAPYPQPHAQAQAHRQAADLGAQVGSAFASLGSALGSFVDQATTGFAVGQHVMVQWSDGNRYPGTVTFVQAGQVQVAFPDGRQVWVPAQYVGLR